VLLAHLLHRVQTFTRIEKLISHKYSSLAWLSVLIFTLFLLPADISGFPRLMVQIILMTFVGSVVITEVKKFGIGSGLLTFVAAFVISILLAEVSFRYFETPFLRLKAKFSIVHQKHA
jgi:Fe2+ transport system protein B